MIRPPAARKTLAALTVAMTCAAFVSLALSSADSESGIFDEPAFIGGGYTQLVLGDYRLMPEHPPLIKVITAFPLLFLPINLPFDAHDGLWERCRPFEWGQRFVYDWNRADAVLRAGRSMIIGVSALLILLVYAWARDLLGAMTGVLAAFLCALSPDVLAHGHYATNDLAVTFLISAALYSFQILIARGSWPRACFTGVLLGAAVSTKFSGLILIPLFALLGLVASFFPAAIDDAGGRPAPSWRAAKRAALLRILTCGTLLLIVAWLAIWGAYGFKPAISPDDEWRARLDWSAETPSNPLAAALVATARTARMLPEGFVFGMSRFLNKIEKRPAFLIGRRSSSGWWYFFPIAFAIKTPVPLMLLFFLGAFMCVRRKRWPVVVFMLVPPLLYMAIAMTRNLNIGSRHLLPIYPFVFIVAAHGAATLLRTRSRAARAGALVGLAWYAGGTLANHPQHLAYFNELVGGPANGYRYLVDSNLDWGQDLPRLRDFLRAHGIVDAKLSYFGTAVPASYGIPCRRLPGQPYPRPRASVVRSVEPGDIVAVSATHLQGQYLDAGARALMRRLRRMKPWARVGHTIFVYKIDFRLSFPER